MTRTNGQTRIEHVDGFTTLELANIEIVNKAAGEIRKRLLDALQTGGIFGTIGIAVRIRDDTLGIIEYAASGTIK